MKRSTSQSRMMGEKLLSQRNSDDLSSHQVREVIDKLTSQLYYHGHPINRSEARDDVGLTFVEDADGPVADAMWDLFVAYEATMLLNTEFVPLFDAIDATGGTMPVPAPGAPPSHQHVELPTVTTVTVESVSHVDEYTIDFTVDLLRQPDGTYAAKVGERRKAWRPPTHSHHSTGGPTDPVTPVV